MLAEGIQRCIFVAILVILLQIHYKLSREPAKFSRILSPNGHNDLEGQGQGHQFSISAESIPWCMFGANLIIPATITNYRADKLKFLEFWDKMAKMTLKFKVNDTDQGSVSISDKTSYRKIQRSVQAARLAV